MKRAIQVGHETYAEIVADNPKITIEDFEKFKETCNEEAAKARSERGKQLQAKKWGTTALEVVVTRERGPCGLRRTQNVNVRGSLTHWMSSPTSRSTTSSGPDSRGTPRKRFFFTDGPTRKFMRILVIILLPPYILASNQ